MAIRIWASFDSVAETGREIVFREQGQAWRNRCDREAHLAHLHTIGLLFPDHCSATHHERQNHSVEGRIDARCMMWPSLRHGGRLTFHQDHISYIWPRKVDQVFHSAWFRYLSHVLSFAVGTKVVKRPTPSANSVRSTRRDSPHVLNDSFSSPCTTKPPRWRRFCGHDPIAGAHSNKALRL